MPLCVDLMMRLHDAADLCTGRWGVTVGPVIARGYDESWDMPWCRWSMWSPAISTDRCLLPCHCFPGFSRHDARVMNDPWTFTAAWSAIALCVSRPDRPAMHGCVAVSGDCPLSPSSLHSLKIVRVGVAVAMKLQLTLPCELVSGL